MALLFRSDWELYPTAIVDTKTTNTSFLKLSYLYKKMGIKNSDFLLALYQPELQGVDPFDPDLPQELKFKIAAEAKYNPWYAIRELFRVRPNSGDVPNRFRGNRGNIALYWSFFNHVDFGLLQPRQTGKSVSTDLLNIGLMHLWASNTTINLITKDSALRQANVERIKETRALLPDYIYYPNPHDSDNTEMVTCVDKGNRYKTSVGRNDKVAADKLGRGLTVPILHFDELAYINLIAISLPVALSSGSAARDEAAKAGQPYGNIYTTTAGNINSRDGKYAYEFMTGGAPWSEHFFDLESREQLVQVVERQSTGLKPLIYGAFNHRQLGETDEWLYRKLRESASHGELADRDYMNIWTTGTEGSPISPEDKARLKDSEREISHMEIFENNYVLRWYIPEDQIEDRMNSSRFGLGADPSECLGNKADATGLVLTDLYTHDVVAAGRFNETNLNHLGVFLAQILIKYPTITFIPERKSSGSGLLDTIFIQLQRHGIDPFKRIYNKIVDEPEKFESEYREIKRPMSSRPTYFYDRFKRHFGFVTAGTGGHARDVLYRDALNSGIKLGASRVHDKTLVNELLSLTTKNGRIDHSTGMHDDMVIAWLLTSWFGIGAKNLSYYGIDSSRVFSLAVKHEKTVSPEDAYRDHQRTLAQQEFNQLLDSLKDEKDQMAIMRTEMRLRQLSRTFDFGETQGVGIDAMIKQAQEERVRKTKVSRFDSSNVRSNNTWIRRLHGVL